MDNDVLQQILAKLESLEAGQAKLEAGQAKLEAKIDFNHSALQADISDVKAGQIALQQDVILMRKDTTVVREAALRLEQNYGDKIGITHDVTIGHTEKLDKHDKKIAWLEDKVDRMDNVQITHTLQLERLAQ